jgi:lysozyme family protein
MNPVINNILALEGGYVNNPADKGGATKWGITENTARSHGYREDMRDLTRDQAYAILEQDYWITPGFSRIAQYSEKLAFELCDAGTNVGPAWPSRWLQRWLNALNCQATKYADLTVDGKIGCQTLQALERYLSYRGHEGEEVLLKGLNSSQGAYYLDITEKRADNETFIYGWIKNRVVL